MFRKIRDAKYMIFKGSYALKLFEILGRHTCVFLSISVYVYAVLKMNAMHV
jgi:hypothetical protein